MIALGLVGVVLWLGCGLFVVVLCLRARELPDPPSPVLERAAARDLHPTTGRQVCGAPRRAPYGLDRLTPASRADAEKRLRDEHRDARGLGG